MKKKRTPKLTALLAFLFGLLFLFSAFMVLRIIVNGQQEQQAFEDLAESIVDTPESPPPSAIADSTQPEESEVHGKPSPYTALKEQNPDFFGWVSIEGTTLDYPVMHTPEDGEYYLRRDFTGNDSKSGVPFLSASCYEGCGNYLIYGHHMNNGTIFASLLSYVDREYWEQHPTIRFDTLTMSGKYEVLAAFYSKVYAQDDRGVFRYYNYTDISEPTVFEEYVEQVLAAALYDTGICASYGDELLTLSTCSYHTENGRFVVVARKEA